MDTVRAPKQLLVLGAGTAGTMVANKLRPRLPSQDWSITVVDQDQDHHYQPGYLFVPFGRYTPDEIVRPREPLLAAGVDLVIGAIDRVLPDDHRVALEDGRELTYDQLIIATGTAPRPDQTPGMTDELWRDRVFDFYTLDGATALRDRLARWEGGRLVVHVCELPIKCPVAPLEFAFLADDFFREKGMRDRVEIVYVTPLDGAFTKPIASRRLTRLLEDRKILVETDFMIERVGTDTSSIVSFDDRDIPFDLLVTVPVNMGADYVARSGLGDELNHVPVDKATSRSLAHGDIWALGDASDLPTSKAGSAAHFSIEVFTENFLDHVAGRPMTRAYDGHVNCFVESGGGKGLLIDFNYDTQPLPGRYPLPGVGPFSLLEESPLNHWGKMAFRWAYWNVLLPGRPLPLPAAMSMRGKHIPDEGEE